MKILNLTMLALLSTGCATTSINDIIDLLVDKGCNLRSFEQRKTDSLKVTCFKTFEQRELPELEE